MFWNKESIVPATMAFVSPAKQILSKEQLEAFQASKTHQDVISFIEALNESVVGVKLSDECIDSEARVFIWEQRFVTRS